jgi:S-adenosylmethionine:tRNA ribosyltransferase-isomerase
MKLPIINSTDYHYQLPEDKIARFPLEKRDESKLLIYKNTKNHTENTIRHKQFKNIVDELDSNFTLFFNNTRVIPARLHFQKETGGIIEIFLLSPVSPHNVVSLAMLETGKCVWKCLVGGLKKWKNDTILSREIISYQVDNQLVIKLSVELINREEQLVQFSWTTENLPFAQVISLFGNTPLPPYLNREAKETDKKQYQTVYAKNEGAVAAPTAGLHFTDEILAVLQQKGVKKDFVTLHVGGGTFQPIKTENAVEHLMHAEQIIVSQQNIKNLLAAQKVCAVGTTSMRTLESLYWLALEVYRDNKIVKNQILLGKFFIEKLQPYQNNDNESLGEMGELPNKQTVMQSLLEFLQVNNLENISGETQIMIIPSYQFRCCDALITNFHQPETTLMLLVAAFVGEDWRKIYETALANDYRFLSYGDSSLLFRN